MSGIVIVFAFDPCDDLEAGLHALDPVRAQRLIDDHLVEPTLPHMHESLRYVAGSAANEAAREELRAARAAPSTPRRARARS